MTHLLSGTDLGVFGYRSIATAITTTTTTTTKTRSQKLQKFCIPNVHLS